MSTISIFLVDISRGRLLEADYAGGEALQKEWALRISKKKQVVRILGYELLSVRMQLQN